MKTTEILTDLVGLKYDEIIPYIDFSGDYVPEEGGWASI